MEVWKDIDGIKGYKVSNLGNVKSLNYMRTGVEKELKQKINRYGYKYVSFYLDKKVKHKTVHQLVAIAFLGHTPCGYKLVVDHIDNDPANNKLENLQLLTNRENVSKGKKGLSKYTGVCWDKRANKWKSYIQINGKTNHLGYFINENEAAEAYQKALKELV